MSIANCDLDELEIVLGDNFEIQFRDNKIYAIRKKKFKYPKGFVDCCKIFYKHL